MNSDERYTLECELKSIQDETKNTKKGTKFPFSNLPARYVLFKEMQAIKKELDEN